MEMSTYKTERRGAQFFYGFLELHETHLVQPELYINHSTGEAIEEV